MSLIKTPEEIKSLKEGGAKLSRVLRAVRAVCVAGVTTKSLDDLAQKLIAEEGGTPSFLNYRNDPHDPGYPAALCVSVNEEVVHGIPREDRVLKDGDIVGLDIGMWYKNLATDMATTVIIGSVPAKVEALVKDTRESLVRAIATVKNGSHISDIGAAIEDYLKPKGYGIVRDLVGHGVGHAVHEDPPIANYRDPYAPRLACKTGMVLALEPMITLGGWQVRQKNDGWTIVTKDGKPSAHFEVTIAVTDEGCDLVTPWPDEEE